MHTDPELEDIVSRTMARVHAVLARGPVDRPALTEIELALADLAAHRELLSFERFALPAGQISVLYTLAADPNGGCTLYANRSDGGLASPPHDHKTWAVIAAVHGTEINQLYRREKRADGSEAVVPDREVALAEGATVGLLPLDVHSIRVAAGTQLLNLHLYGTAMERQADRRRFDAGGRDAGHYAPQPLIL